MLFNMICYCIGQKIDSEMKNSKQSHKIRRESMAKDDPERRKNEQGHKIRRESMAKNDPERRKANRVTK